MSLFDYYHLQYKRRCPNCFEHLSDWQGTDGPNGLFSWRQHHAAPIDQLVDDDEVKISEAMREQERLPEVFSINTTCESCKTQVVAEGLCIKGIWRYLLIREPDIPYPSGEEHILFRLNILIDDLAKRCGRSVSVMEESGMGIERAFHTKLNFDAYVTLLQSDHLIDRDAFGDKAHKGPVVYVDAYDAVKYGYEHMYWGALHALNISQSYVEREYPEKDKWLDEARALLNRDWPQG